MDEQAEVAVPSAWNGTARSEELPWFCARDSSRFTLFTCASNTSTPASPAGSAVAAGTGRLVYSFTFPPSPLGSG